jgi:hypothetical protein
MSLLLHPYQLFDVQYSTPLYPLVSAWARESITGYMTAYTSDGRVEQGPLARGANGVRREQKGK